MNNNFELVKLPCKLFSEVFLVKAGKKEALFFYNEMTEREEEEKPGEIGYKFWVRINGALSIYIWVHKDLEEELKITTAYHEAGHAIFFLLELGGDFKVGRVSDEEVFLVCQSHLAKAILKELQ